MMVCLRAYNIAVVGLKSVKTLWYNFKAEFQPHIDDPKKPINICILQ